MPAAYLAPIQHDSGCVRRILHCTGKLDATEHQKKGLSHTLVHSLSAIPSALHGIPTKNSWEKLRNFILTNILRNTVIYAWADIINPCTIIIIISYTGLGHQQCLKYLVKYKKNEKNLIFTITFIVGSMPREIKAGEMKSYTWSLVFVQNLNA